MPGFNHFPGFPHLVLPGKPSYANQTYARSLFASGHGYALFTPVNVSYVPEDFTATRGISIGDVGVLNEDSEFLFAFNIFLPADHPYNKDDRRENDHLTIIGLRGSVLDDLGMMLDEVFGLHDIVESQGM